MNKLNSIKLIALDIDGVALKDTFSPIIYSLVKKWGFEYTADIERNVFSQSQNKAARYLIDTFKLALSEKELLELYFNERKVFLETNDGGIIDGLEEFLKLAQNLQLPVVCYGGLKKDHFEEKLRDYMHYFDGEQYICTNDFRPGIKEIATKYYSYRFNEVLFIDDVNKVAEDAKSLGVPFIGIPSKFHNGFQRQGMLDTGVKYILDSIKDIDENLIRKIDLENLKNELWNK